MSSRIIGTEQSARQLRVSGTMPDDDDNNNIKYYYYISSYSSNNTIMYHYNRYDLLGCADCDVLFGSNVIVRLSMFILMLYVEVGTSGMIG